MAANRLVEWLPDSLASARPSTPGQGVYLHRATDTGAITLWDGTAWRDLDGGGGASPVYMTFAVQASATLTPAAFPSGVRLSGFVSGASGRWVGDLTIHVYQYSGVYYRDVVNGSSGYVSGSAPGNAVVAVDPSTGELTVTFPEAVTGTLLVTPIVTPT